MGVDMITPPLVVADPSLAILDVRPRPERFGELGFIPGSRWFPEERLRERPFLLTDDVAPDRGVVLACLTGRRSAALVPFVRALGYPRTYNLEGGLLAWASSLPLCGRGRAPATAPGTQSVDEIMRELSSCFVAESVENILSRGLDEHFDPREVVRDIEMVVFARHPEPDRDALVEVVERLGELARARGHSLETIAVNVNRFLDMIDRVAEPVPDLAWSS